MEKAALHVNALYIPNEVLDDGIDNFDSNECLMHGDNGVTHLSSIFWTF